MPDEAAVPPILFCTVTKIAHEKKQQVSLPGHRSCAVRAVLQDSWRFERRYNEVLLQQPHRYREPLIPSTSIVALSTLKRMELPAPQKVACARADQLHYREFGVFDAECGRRFTCACTRAHTHVHKYLRSPCLVLCSCGW